MKEKLKKLEKLINKSKKILLLTHSKMDGDAIGSVGAFYNILSKLGKTVKTTNDIMPGDNFSFLGINKIFEENLDIEKYNPDLTICLDTTSVNQLGKIYEENQKFFKGKEIVVIDHHEFNTKFGNLNITDKESSSTCEIVFHIFKKLGYLKNLSKKSINLLLAGIITDTNVFYNKNTNSNTLVCTSKLLDMGGDLNKIIYNFFYKISYEKTKLKGLVFNKIEKNKDGKIVWVKITKEDFKNTKTTPEYDTSGIVSELLNINGCEIAFIIYEFGKENKISFRAKKYDVGKLSSSFPGGGGHKLAAGFKSNDSMEIIEKEILKKIKF